MYPCSLPNVYPCSLPNVYPCSLPNVHPCSLPNVYPCSLPIVCPPASVPTQVLEGVKNTVRVLPVSQERVRPPRIFHVDRVLRPFLMSEATAQSMLVHCRPMTSRRVGGETMPEQEYYVAHFSVAWSRRNRAAGSPKLLLITSQRVVFGDELRLRPIWETRVERIARVELKVGYVMVWLWEKVGPGTPTYSYNIVVERIIFCNDPVVLEAMFERLWSVAMQRDRALLYSHRRGLPGPGLG